MIFDLKNFKWVREPKKWKLDNKSLEIITEPNTDLWQRTYYHFKNDNAPCFQLSTAKPYFSFTVKTSFLDAKHRFDQCGVIVYMDSDNWIKASVEYENEEYQHLGSVVTNNGYSDWATTTIDSSIKEMWYRLSRREDDFKIESSIDGINFRQMRICHFYKGSGEIYFGVYAASPESSSFKACFTDFNFGPCIWLKHDGQKPDDN